MSINLQNNQNEQKNQTLCLEYQKKLNMSGVSAVDAFSDTMLKLSVNGNRVIINGENIKITSYSKTTGTLQADGVFNSIKYEGSKSPLIKRIFK